MDWDDDATWPRGTGAASKPAAAAADNGGQPERQFDVVLGADLLYTRSYARKVASVATRLLKPGGLLVLTTPRARGGYGERNCQVCSCCLCAVLSVCFYVNVRVALFSRLLAGRHVSVHW